MKLIRKAGATSNILQVFIADSSSTTGAGLTGLAFGSSGLTAYYHRDTDTTATAITLVTMTVGTFTSSGFKEIDATNMPGWYQICPPNAALAAGSKSVAFHLKGVTNMAPLPIEIDLVAYDPMDAAALGLTNLDATVSTRLATAGYTAPPTAAQNATAVLTTQMTESYATLHTVPTLAQILFENRSLLAEKSVSSTTLTAKKIDGSTTAGAYTLNDATSPTAITRAS